MRHYTLTYLFGVCLLACVKATKPEVEMSSGDSKGSPYYVESGYGQGNEMDYVNAYLNGLTGAVNPEQDKDLESSASNKRSYGYGHGHGGSGYGGGSLIGGAIGSILSRILRSLSGIGLRLGLNLNNEIYTVPDYYGGGGYGGYGHRRMQTYAGNAEGYGHGGGVAYGNYKQGGGQGQPQNVDYGIGNEKVYGDYIGRH